MYFMYSLMFIKLCVLNIEMYVKCNIQNKRMENIYNGLMMWSTNRLIARPIDTKDMGH